MDQGHGKLIVDHLVKKFPALFVHGRVFKIATESCLGLLFGSALVNIFQKEGRTVTCLTNRRPQRLKMKAIH
jgi:hypothetical protein